MNNIKSFPNHKQTDEEQKQKCIALAEEIVENLKSGKITSFAAVGVSENLANEFYVSGSGTSGTDVIMTGSIYRLLAWLTSRSFSNEP